MNSKIRATYKWVAPILLIMFGAFLINIKGNTKMATWNSWYNPLDNIANAVSGFGNTLTGGATGSQYNTMSNPDTVYSSGTSTPQTQPQVLGDSVEGAMYYDSASGTFKGVGGSEIPNAIGGTQTPTRPAPVDPFARWGGKANYDAGVGQINQGKTNAINNANSGIGSNFTSSRNSIMDFIDEAGLTQRGIDTKRANAQFSQLEGKGDIMDMVGRGIRSGGVMLANKNAGSSGAAGQIARAYGELGNREVRDVNNQFELENQGINVEQEALGTAFGKQKRDLDTFKTTTAQSIADTARNELSVLEAQRIGASLPELFAIDQEVQAIKNNALAKFGELDTLLSTEQAKIKPTDGSGIRARAYGMQQAGTGGPQMFNFNTNAAQIQSGGPSVAGAEIPTYSNTVLNKRREV